jgi:hypothetical protein
MNRYLRIIIIVDTIIIGLIAVGFLSYPEIKKFSKNNFGGIVINKTNKNLIVLDNKEEKIVPSHTTSHEAGIFDVDFIIIDRPLKFEGKTYTRGVIKMCDFTTISIVDKQSSQEVQTKPSALICKLINDFRWQPKAYPTKTDSKTSTSTKNEP